MTNLQFMDALLTTIRTRPTAYATGAFGAPTGYKNNSERYYENTKKNIGKAVADKILAAPDGTFLFDCLGFGKGHVWSFSGDPNARYGGAKYEDGCPDFSVKSLHKHCDDWKEDGCPEDALEYGEWMRVAENNHVGYYAGNGLVAEMTSRGESVAIISKLSDRNWQGHGKLKYLTYLPKPAEPEYVKIGMVSCPHCEQMIALYTKEATGK